MAPAQDVFFTQSGGRGLQNAKMNARMSKAEGDITVINTELAKIQPFAKLPIPSCTDAGAKLRWTGGDWSCDEETDPTVQSFAKKALPSCGSGQILSASGSDFTCVNSGFLSAETDPTVQTFAKSPLPSCGTGEVLSVGGSGLTCTTDERGLTQETDPYVHTFARTSSAAPNCDAGKVLTMNSDHLECVFDAVGITVETDPKVQAFARNDIAGASLTACASGQVVQAVSGTGNVLLQCVDGSTALAPVLSAQTLAGLADVGISGPQNDEVLRFSGSKWVNTTDYIGSLGNNQWCYFNGTNITCDRDRPAPMPGGGCSSGEIISWSNSVTAWECVSAGTAVGAGLALTQLSDVNIVTSTLVPGESVLWNGSKFTNGYASRIQVSNTSVAVVDTGTGLIQLVTDGVAALTATANKIGIGTNAPNAPLDVIGLVSASNLAVAGYVNTGVLQTSSYISAGSVHTSGTVKVSNTTYTDALRVNGDAFVAGNLYVSGSQSFDGVTFANGGVSASGVVTATSFYGDGSHLTGIGTQADRIISGTTSVIANNNGSVTITTGGSERMIIGATGNIGIGVVNPTYRLEVAGAVRSSGDGFGFEPADEAGSYTARLQYRSALLGLSNIANLRLAGLAGTSAFTVSDYDSAIRFIVNRTGNVGIGTVTPTATLQVSGSMIVSSSGQTVNPSLYVGTNGNVGIGIGNPSYALDVSGTMNNGGVLDFRNSVHRLLGTDSNLSIINNSSGMIRLFTGGAARLAVLNNGNIGISTSSPNAKLDVHGDISATNLRLSGNLYVSGSQSFDGVTFANDGVSATGTITATSFAGDGSGLTGLAQGDRIISGTTNVIANSNGSVTVTTGGSQRMIVGANGNVGIGTATPGAPLTVYGSGAGIVVQDPGNNYPSVRFKNLNNDWEWIVNGSTNQMILKNTAAGVWPIVVDGTATNQLLNLKNTNVGIGTTGPQATLQVSGSMIVSTTGQTTTPTLYVGTNGNVGVGTNSPGSPLEVVGQARITSGNASGGLRLGADVNATTLSAGVRKVARITVPTYADAALNSFLIAGDNVNGANGVYIGGYPGSSVYAATDLHFLTASTAATDGGTERLTITNSGNIGISNTSPNAKLDIYGAGNTADFRITRAANSFYSYIAAPAGTFPQSTFGIQGAAGISIQANGGVGIGGGNFTDGAVALPLNGLAVSGSVGIGTVAPNAKLDVYGTISATNFVGNGSGLTGITASSSDRIVSGTTSMVAVSNTGFISLTQAGTNTGWFDPQRGFVTIGVSSTGPISGTNGYFSGNVGIGTSTPSARLDVAGGNIDLDLSSLIGAVSYGTFTYDGRPMAEYGLQWTADSWNANAPTLWASSYSGIKLLTKRLVRVVVTENGNIGIGTVTPTATLQISGSMIVSTTGQITTPTLYAGTNGNVGIGTNAPAHALDVSGSINVGALASLYFRRADGTTESGRIYTPSNSEFYVLGTNSYLNMGARDGVRLFGNAAFSVPVAYAAGNGRFGLGGGAHFSNAASVSQTLHVSGTVLTTSWTYINANVNVRVTPTTELEVNGTVSATNFVGNGAGLTGIGQGDRITSGTASVVANQNTGVSVSTPMDVVGAVKVSGTVQVAGTGSEGCVAGAYGTFRFNPSTGRMQVCRP